MRSLRPLLALAGALLMLLALPLRAQDTTTLDLTRRVVDIAGVLSGSDVESIASELKSYEDSTGNQFVVLVVRSLEGQTIEDYAVRTFHRNGIGQKGKNNGLLMVVAINERKIRIEVGYGLESVLPDALTAQIRESEITPQFKQGNYAQGIRQGLHALMAAAAGEYKGSSNNDSGGGFGWFIFLPFLIAGIVFLTLFIVSRKARRSGTRGRRHSSGSSSYDTTNTWSSTWSSSSSSDSSSWSSSSSDNSFSGGGGDSGGGGSTGDW